MRRFGAPSLLVRFCGLSLVCFVLVGTALDRVRVEHFERIFIGQGIREVDELAERLGPYLQEEGRVPAAADRMLHRVRADDDYLDLRIVAPDGTVLRADDGRLRDARTTRPAALQQALRGQTVGEIHHDDVGPVRQYSAPVHDVHRHVHAVIEVELRDPALWAVMSSAQRRATMVLALGLGGLWLLLLPAVVRASGRLRRHAGALAVLAHTDELTGLANRRALMSRLDALPGDDPAGLAIIDMDGFKAVNTLLGQAHGDEALRLAAGRFAAAVGEQGTVFRLGGDEFALLAPGADAPGTRRLAQAACSALDDLRIEGRRLGARAGFACAPGDASTVSQLMGRAGAALAAAKRDREGARVLRYHPGNEAAVRSLDEQRAEIQAMLAAPDGLSVIYQPIVGLGTGDVLGYEALSRFGDATRPPDSWFAQARAVGLGDELEAAALRAALSATGRPDGTYLSVNLSPGALGSSAVEAALPEGLSGLVIEITEHELVRDYARLCPLVESLRARGARIAVDDAGAGYAGLRQIVEVAPDIVKIDRSLIDGLAGDGARQALVEAFVRYAAHLGADVCAEGVEDIATAALLVRLDVGCAQGYAFARPGEPWAQPAAEAVAACRAATAEILAGATQAARLTVHRIATIGDELYAATSVQEVAALLAEIAGSVEAAKVTLSLYDAATESLRAIAVPGTDVDDEIYRLADYPASAQALRERRALQAVVTDESADAHERALLQRTGFGALALFPIVWHGRTLGVVEAFTRDARPFRAANLGRMRIVAQLLASVLARLLEEEAAEPPAAREVAWPPVGVSLQTR